MSNDMGKEKVALARTQQEIAQLNAPVELFKTLATFGFLASAMFCLGSPLILGFSPHLESCFRHIMTALSGIAGFSIVVCILVFYYKLPRGKVESDSANNG